MVYTPDVFFLPGFTVQGLVGSCTCGKWQKGEATQPGNTIIKKKEDSFIDAGDL